jgi:hypothetical protein
MINLVANEITKLTKPANKDRSFLISTKFSATASTRIAYTPDALSGGSGGFYIGTMTNVLVFVPAGEALFIVSDDVGPAGLAEIVGQPVNAVKLY